MSSKNTLEKLYMSLKLENFVMQRLQNICAIDKSFLLATFFRLIWNQTKFRLAPNHSENGNYNPTFVRFNKIHKIFFCANAWRRKLWWELSFFSSLTKPNINYSHTAMLQKRKLIPRKKKPFAVPYNWKSRRAAAAGRFPLFELTKEQNKIFSAGFFNANSRDNTRQRGFLQTLRKLCFHFLSHWMGYDRGGSFPFDFEPNGFPFGSKSIGKLSPRSYPI